MKGRGIDNVPEIPNSSPSSQPSPLEGEGVFLTFYDSINFISVMNLYFYFFLCVLRALCGERFL